MRAILSQRAIASVGPNVRTPEIRVPGAEGEKGYPIRESKHGSLSVDDAEAFQASHNA